MILKKPSVSRDGLGLMKWPTIKLFLGLLMIKWMKKVNKLWLKLTKLNRNSLTRLMKTQTDIWKSGTKIRKDTWDKPKLISLNRWMVELFLLAVGQLNCTTIKQVNLMVYALKLMIKARSKSIIKMDRLLSNDLFNQ